MAGNIIVRIFGVSDRSFSVGGCSCGGACGPAPTTGDLYKELALFLSKSEVAGNLDIEFIDVLSGSIDKYPEVKNALEKKMKMPLTMINGEIRYSGGFSPWQILSEVKVLLQK